MSFSPQHLIELFYLHVGFFGGDGFQLSLQAFFVAKQGLVGEKEFSFNPKRFIAEVALLLATYLYFSSFSVCNGCTILHSTNLSGSLLIHANTMLHCRPHLESSILYRDRRKFRLHAPHVCKLVRHFLLQLLYSVM